jgi:Raf kinase inhibitor-like YbhB/YbcL family protein
VTLVALLAALTLSSSSFTLTSSAFAPGARIPKKYTCDGGLQPVSPPLRWTAGPSGTRAFAIRVDDTDAHFVHWLGWGISGSARGLKVGQHPAHEEPNGLGQSRYDGPCPQDHRVHHYVFRVYALDKNVAPSLAGLFPKAHVLAVASLVGTYKR